MAANERSNERKKHFNEMVSRLSQTATQPVTLMEVCGTHTMAIGKSGIRSVLPESVNLISGPGCPVCVTADSDINAFMELARDPRVILTTYGDMMKVPGSNGSLATLKSDGAEVRVVYSGFEALDIARANPKREVVFLGVGFETTAPATAHAIKTAHAESLSNFSVYNLHKTVPIALRVLIDDPETNIDGFILPGHVSVIIGEKPYLFLANEYNVSGTITGFEAPEIMASIVVLVKHINADDPTILNLYKSAVKPEGNVVAQALLDEIFEVSDAEWRGIGVIPGSGLKLRDKFANFDASVRFDIQPKDVPMHIGCRCGEILKGRIRPNQCPLYARKCTPDTPVGPCMVSSEGTCAAYYMYSDVELEPAGGGR